MDKQTFKAIVTDHSKVQVKMVLLILLISKIMQSKIKKFKVKNKIAFICSSFLKVDSLFG